MCSDKKLPPQVRWSQMRFAVVGSLLVQPPPTGELRARLLALAEQEWPHPTINMKVRFSFSTIERWYYKALQQERPTEVLQRKGRKDAGQSWSMTEPLIEWLRLSYIEHPAWSYLLHYQNLQASLTTMEQEAERKMLPSYPTVRRFMKRKGWRPCRCVADRLDTPGALKARERFRSREIRLFEHTHSHMLWHIDGHHGSLPLLHDGEKRRPILIAVLDDHSRLICHLQWFWHEDAPAAAHVLMQAISKRGIPRMILSDNGGAYNAAEITQGLHRLGVMTNNTLCYSPYQNGKCETLWSLVESRLLAMLHQQSDLTLYRLNELTQAWTEHEYHHRLHAGINCTPLSRYTTSPHVGRVAPTGIEMAHAFTLRDTRRQRHSDGSLCVSGKRFAIPSRYRHLDTVAVRYATWDLNTLFLAHPDTDVILERLHPVDREGNASGARAFVEPPMSTPEIAVLRTTPPPLPQLLQLALDSTRSSNKHPAFIPFNHEPRQEPRHDAAR